MKGLLVIPKYLKSHSSFAEKPTKASICKYASLLSPLYKILVAQRKSLVYLVESYFMYRYACTWYDKLTLGTQQQVFCKSRYRPKIECHDEWMKEL